MIAKGIITVMLLGFSALLSAQDTVYLDKKHCWTDDKAQAVEYCIITKERKSVNVAFHSLDGRLKGMCQYSKYTADPDKRILNGKSTSLYFGGKDSLVFNYVKNKRDGEQIIYYPDGKIKSVRLMKKGKLLKITQYYQNGILRRLETFGGDTSKSKGGTLYNENGKEITFAPYFTRPSFPGGDSAFYVAMKKYLRYPQKALNNKSEGKVYVQLYVGKTGKMGGPRVVMSSNNVEMEKAVLRAVEALGMEFKFVPGTEDGQPVSMPLTIPVTFRL